MMRAIKMKLRASLGSSGFLAKAAVLGLGWFDREIQAVMAGVDAHKRSAQNAGGRRARLVRNTHRVEKGLIHKQRRPVFGLDYLPALIADFEATLQSCELSAAEGNGSLQWTRDVLTEYFDGAGSHPVVDPLRERFLRATGEMGELMRKRPYQRELSAPCPVSFEAFMKLCHRRRSVRWFLDKPVPRELLDQALMAARQSPSACNRQPFVFWIADDPGLAGKIGGIPGGTSGFAHNFPCVIALVGDLSAYHGAHDRHVIYIDGSLAAMSFVLALETLGLSSCIINWPDHAGQEKKLREHLPLKPWERVVFLIAVGYPDPEGKVPFSEKKDLPEIRRFNFE